MYLFLLPLGVYIARFFKSKPYWVSVHITLQATASVGITMFLIIILVCAISLTFSSMRLEHMLFLILSLELL
jgi:hypothetical protein